MTRAQACPLPPRGRGRGTAEPPGQRAYRWCRPRSRPWRTAPGCRSGGSRPRAALWERGHGQRPGRSPGQAPGVPPEAPCVPPSSGGSWPGATLDSWQVTRPPASANPSSEAAWWGEGPGGGPWGQYGWDNASGGPPPWPPGPTGSALPLPTSPCGLTPPRAPGPPKPGPSTWDQDVPEAQEGEGPVTQGQRRGVESGHLQHHGELGRGGSVSRTRQPALTPLAQHLGRGHHIPSRGWPSLTARLPPPP